MKGRLEGVAGEEHQQQQEDLQAKNTAKARLPMKITHNASTNGWQFR